MQNHRKTHNWEWQATRRKDLVDPELVPKEKENFMPHVDHPNTWELHWRKKPLKLLALETSRPYVWGIWELWGSKILL